MNLGFLFSSRNLEFVADFALYCDENRIKKPTADDVREYIEKRFKNQGEYGCSIESNN